MTDQKKSQSDNQQEKQKAQDAVTYLESQGSKYCLATNPPGPQDCGDTTCPGTPHWYDE